MGTSSIRDPSASPRLAARESAGGRTDVAFLEADAMKLPFEDALFDIVATSKTTHHIPRWIEMLAEAVRVLRPGGYLVYSDLTVPHWASGALRHLVGRRAGVFSARDLDCAFGRSSLEARHVSRGRVYEGVFVKRALAVGGAKLDLPSPERGLLAQ